MSQILIVFFSLISLIIAHEFGHFLLAKKFGVDVEEFGIGYPPRIFGKKIGKTFYSFNLLPFGAFVKIRGEGGEFEDSKSFISKPIWQRTLIVLGGIFAFWLIAWILISITMGLGIPLAISEEAKVSQSKIQIIATAKNSPAEKSGLRVGDFILQMESTEEKIENIQKVEEVQEFINSHLGKEVLLTIKRGKTILEAKLTPRLNPPQAEGPMGIVLTRTINVSYPWYKAPFEGFLTTANLTFSISKGTLGIISDILFKRALPPGVEVLGPIGIFNLSSQMISLGINYYLRFLALTSIYLAVFNILPIPALDGGKLIFLGIEAVRKKRVSRKIEQSITVFFFALLIFLMILVTIKDVLELF
ncbi:hypothetical protein AMJ49_01615 [Parcubacteria bacterium DG_74_2]|nr:MAG: hypothetical protein AMJ49_01615 [Parcubacteria bacterium DG_74_2]